jgi:AcrR family transcriptional regulator
MVPISTPDSLQPTVLFGTMSRPAMPQPTPHSQPLQKNPGLSPARRRILDAAFSAFTTHGYTQTSTLEIASQAKVSKRELYSLVGNKQETLVACINERAKRLRPAPDLSSMCDREALAQVLTGFGELILREITEPGVVAVYRIAIAEAERVPQIARILDSVGREAGRAGLRGILKQARSLGFLNGDLEEMAEQFLALLWGILLTNLLLGLSNRPQPKQIKRRARRATTAFLRLYSS